MARKSNLDKFRDVMFTDVATLKNFTPVELEQLKRYRFAFTVCLDNPSIPDIALRDKLMAEYGMSQTQAYRDIGNVKIILPSVRNAGREWIRYIVNEELKKVIQDINGMLDDYDDRYKEDDDGNIIIRPDYKEKAALLSAKILAIDKLGKYNKLNKDDEFELNWDEIVPIPIEPTNDVSVLDVKPIENLKELKAKLYEKYKGEIEIEDIPFEETKDQDDYERD